MIAIAEPHWSAPPSHFGSTGGLTLQLPAVNAPQAATTPKASAILLSMDWQACFSKTWAWWKMQNSKTRGGNSNHCQSRLASSHVECVWLSLNSQRKAPLLIVAVKREFSGTYAPLVLESNRFRQPLFRCFFYLSQTGKLQLFLKYKKYILYSNKTQTNLRTTRNQGRCAKNHQKVIKKATQLRFHLIVGTKQQPVDWFSVVQKFFPSLGTNKSG